ncbi:hypothetical protein DF220_05425 [Salinibacterium hongtaonis]|uniref:GGDEF domain-containing protein n=2 Tax=Homoserinimonas hongtaonis TaxID=2079791 RepID=A0A2U1T0E7_9MICO|nr:hypothetical protein DF220_05425 [Salinibacterium hongtaonis]
MMSNHVLRLSCSGFWVTSPGLGRMSTTLNPNGFAAVPGKGRQVGIPFSTDDSQRLQLRSPEPQTSPGTVQASGIMLGISASPSSATVIAVSDSCESLWGLRPDEVLDRPLDDFVPGYAPSRSGSLSHSSPQLVTDFHGTTWYSTATFMQGQTVLSLEPGPGEATPDSTIWLAEAAMALDDVADVRELWALGCDTVRSRIGFDRTIAIEFHEAGHGEIVAESVVDGFDQFVGLHFAASDIPREARAATGRVRSTLVRDAEAMPSIVVPRSDRTGTPWNLSLSPLRNPAHRHLEFMRSMGNAATLTLHLPSNAGVAYMMVSHSREARTVDPLTRASIEIYARLLLDRVATLARNAELHRRANIVAIVHQLTERIGDGSILDALSDAARTGIDTVGGLELIHAEAGIINVRGKLRTLGHLTLAEAQAIHDTVNVWLQTLSRHGALLTNRVSEVHPKLAEAAPEVAGLLAVSIGSQGDYLCWVRRPVDQTVRWFGSLAAESLDSAATASRDLSPRTDSITDASRPWSATDREVAEELAREIDDRLLRRVQADLAQQALVDSLTGLPNRRLLLDRLNSALARASRGHHCVVLFIDLNDFKEVNDRFGHRAGDAILVETARRLTEVVRETDTVARLAGDEFVVLCEDTMLGEDEAVAERVRQAFEQPFNVFDIPLPVRAAIGIGQLELGVDAAGMLDRADRAMYEAKATMKDAPRSSTRERPGGSPGEG